jgi:2'-5' RNA ligase
MDRASCERFEALRRAHFPPALNRVPAHVTLFHHLPGEAEAEIGHELRALCAGTTAFTVRATGLRFMGRGVAYELASSELQGLRRRLAERWQGWLNAQDRQGWRPHVTVQNKASGETAKATFAALQAAFAPFDVGADGLQLWWYRGGPWEAASEFRFSLSSRP